MANIPGGGGLVGGGIGSGIVGGVIVGGGVVGGGIVGGGIGGGIGGTILATKGQASDQGQSTIGAASCQSCVGQACAGCVNEGQLRALTTSSQVAAMPRI